MTITTAVIDTADWPLAVPLQPAAGRPIDFSGSTLTIALTPIFGGPVVAEASSADGSLTFVPASGAVPAYFALDLPVAGRAWRIGRPTTVAGDILRRPDPDGPAVEWLGRVTLRVLPGSDSSAIAQAAPAPVLIDAQPYDGRIATAPMLVGPQGARGPIGNLPPLPVDAGTKTYTLIAVNGFLAWA